jgi:DnaJ-class molecular chaperone
MDCPNCKGEGRAVRKAFTQDGIQYPETTVNCYECNGTGELCDECGEAINVCGGGQLTQN